MTVCEICGGTGYDPSMEHTSINDYPCPECQGDGVIESKEELAAHE